MPIDKVESETRKVVDGLRAKLGDLPVTSRAAIRAAAIDKFTRELDGKLKNLQEGETLQITYRVDLVRENNAIRGGSGSARNMPEYIAWRKAVYGRDGYTCQDCGAKKTLTAHHVKQWAHYPALRFDVSNGVTLCGACHAKKHPHLNFRDPS